MDPGTLTPIVISNLASVGMLGSSASQLAAGLANGLSIYATTSIIFQSVDIGTLGSGVGSGVGILVPPAITASMVGSFAANGMLGVMSSPLATGIAQAFMQSFALATISTFSPTVGVGTGTGVCVPNPGASIGIFAAAFASAGMLGISALQLATAVATGLDSILPSSTGAVVITGSPSNSPSSSTGLGKLL